MRTFILTSLLIFSLSAKDPQEVINACKHIKRPKIGPSIGKRSPHFVKKWKKMKDEMYQDSLKFCLDFERSLYRSKNAPPSKFKQRLRREKMKMMREMEERRRFRESLKKERIAENKEFWKRWDDRRNKSSARFDEIRKNFSKGREESKKESMAKMKEFIEFQKELFKEFLSIFKSEKS